MSPRHLLRPFSRSGPSGRALRTFVPVLLLGLLAGAVSAAHPFVTSLPATTVEDRLAPYDTTPTAGVAPLHLGEQSYAIWAQPNSAVITLSTPDGHVYTSIPLAVVAGRSELPDGDRAHTWLHDGRLTAQIADPSGTVVSQADLVPAAHSFTVAFSASAGPERTPTTGFFADGHRGVAMAGISEGFTPDPRGLSSSLAPAVSTVSRTPFAPPPLQVQLHAAPGWFGIGLVEVPSATTMSLGHDGTLAIDYPLTAAAGGDLGAGPPTADGMVHFPRFVVTFSPDPGTGLRAYHDALTSMNAITVASPPGTRPAWWSEPLVDTWGEQLAEQAQRSSPAFTAQWVRNFAADWKARYHVDHFTLVIDSRWQERIGDAMPDPVRFGGAAGMRALIDELHAQGCHVLLWWPMWGHGVVTVPMSARQARTASASQIVDPTASQFSSQMAKTVADMLGTGPDQLGADGLKLDWQYDIPQTVADPAGATGALALYRYMDAIHTDAHALRHDAMIDASAAAPQFAAVADTVRLYDAWSAAEWDRRAAMVAAVDPGMLIDGDGWQADLGSIVPHTVASTVYGTPAVYFGRSLTARVAVSPALSNQLGSVVSLSAMKGQGNAVPLADGEWRYEVGSTVTAETFAHERALVVRAPSCTPTWTSVVASAVGGRLVVPMTGSRFLGAVDAQGRHVQGSAVQHGVLLTVQAGGVYTLSFSGGC